MKFSAIYLGASLSLFVFLRIECERELQVNDSEIRNKRHRRETKISVLTCDLLTRNDSHIPLFVLLYVPLDESQGDYS
jgi:hypothetical protein